MLDDPEDFIDIFLKGDKCMTCHFPKEKVVLPICECCGNQSKFIFYMIRLACHGRYLEQALRKQPRHIQVQTLHDTFEIVMKKRNVKVEQIEEWKKSAEKYVQELKEFFGDKSWEEILNEK